MPRSRKRGASVARGKAKNVSLFPQGPQSATASVDTHGSLFSNEDLIYSSNFDVYQEVTIEDEVQEVNVENSRSNTPTSATFDSCSNENSTSSAAQSDLQLRFWTREEDLTPSAVLPDNLFMDDDMTLLNNEQSGKGVQMNDSLMFGLNDLFPVKEEPCEDMKVKPTEVADDSSRKNVRRRVQPESSAVNKKLTPLTSLEEYVLLKQLQHANNKGKLTPEQRRLYRKLSLRSTKRSVGMRLFSFDQFVASLSGQEWNEAQVDDLRTSSNPNVLDRFQKAQLKTSSLNPSLNYSFRMRLVGSEDQIPQSFVSPYTGRTLKPFIRRDYESRPLKLRLLEEIRNRGSSKSISDSCKPIDYCYVQPHHIAAVSAMCRDFFWAGIDLTECLEYPDFSCVVLYGHLVIGFAFMVPDVSYNEAYISYIFTHPEWRRAGIARFMLYHLIQSCMGKDVTLHVSATNTAINLYHQFCFKVEEFIVDFYDKYLPASSAECKHAFFMRLTR